MTTIILHGEFMQSTAPVPSPSSFSPRLSLSEATAAFLKEFEPDTKKISEEKIARINNIFTQLDQDIDDSLMHCLDARLPNTNLLHYVAGVGDISLLKNVLNRTPSHLLDHAILERNNRRLTIFEILQQPRLNKAEIFSFILDKLTPAVSQQACEMNEKLFLHLLVCETDDAALTRLFKKMDYNKIFGSDETFGCLLTLFLFPHSSSVISAIVEMLGENALREAFKQHMTGVILVACFPKVRYMCRELLEKENQWLITTITKTLIEAENASAHAVLNAIDIRLLHEAIQQQDLFHLIAFADKKIYNRLSSRMIENGLSVPCDGISIMKLETHNLSKLLYQQQYKSSSEFFFETETAIGRVINLIPNYLIKRSMAAAIKETQNEIDMQMQVYTLFTAKDSFDPNVALLIMEYTADSSLSLAQAKTQLFDYPRIAETYEALQPKLKDEPTELVLEYLIENPKKMGELGYVEIETDDIEMKHANFPITRASSPNPSAFWYRSEKLNKQVENTEFHAELKTQYFK